MATVKTVPAKSLKFKQFSLKEVVEKEFITSLKEVIEAQVNDSLKDVIETDINIALKALIEAELHNSLKQLINAKVHTSLRGVVREKVKTSLKEVVGREIGTSLEGRTYKLIEKEVKTSLSLKENEEEFTESIREILNTEICSSTREVINIEVPKCKDSITTLLELKKLLAIFSTLTSELKKDAEKEKLKEWQGSRKLLKSIRNRREAIKQELILLIVEKKSVLERLMENEDHAPIQ